MECFQCTKVLTSDDYKLDLVRVCNTYGEELCSDLCLEKHLDHMEND